MYKTVLVRQRAGAEELYAKLLKLNLTMYRMYRHTQVYRKLDSRDLYVSQWMFVK